MLHEHTGPEELLEAPSGYYQPGRKLLRKEIYAEVGGMRKASPEELGEEDPGNGYQ